MVVAHSPTLTKRITSRFHGRLFRIDHNIGGSETPLALVAEEGETLVLDSVTGRTTEPVREFPLGQLARSMSAELSDRQMQEFLAQAPVIETRPLGRGSTRPQLVVLEARGEVRRGIFKTVGGDAGGDRYEHEVAAYLLDRILGLGMVPVTVLRTLEGRPGSLQAWVDGALDQEAAEDYNMEFFETEGKASQLTLARVFDALIGNAERKRADVLGLVNRDQILLIDHSKAFSTSTELPPRLGPLRPVPETMVEALASLDRTAVERQLGALLSEAQIDALLERRDKLLARLAAPVRAASLAGDGADPGDRRRLPLLRRDGHPVRRSRPRRRARPGLRGVLQPLAAAADAGGRDAAGGGGEPRRVARGQRGALSRRGRPPRPPSRPRRRCPRGSPSGPPRPRSGPSRACPGTCRPSCWRRRRE